MGEDGGAAGFHVRQVGHGGGEAVAQAEEGVEQVLRVALSLDHALGAGSVRVAAICAAEAIICNL